MSVSLIKKNIKNQVFLYGLVATLLFCIVGLLLWTDILSAASYYYFALSLVLVLGILHVFLMHRLIAQIRPGDFWKGLGFTFLLMLLGAVAVGIIYYFLQLNFILVTFVLPFFIPFLCWYTGHFFIKIPPRFYKIWYYPINDTMPDLDMIDLTQMAVVQFIFHKKQQDANPISFTSKAPLDMTLGQLFFIFINDYNEKNSQGTIEFLDTQQSPNGWLFYRKNKWFNRKYYFDPELSFRQNTVAPNEFIYATRVIAQA
jgi:hypothetical protein